MPAGRVIDRDLQGDAAKLAAFVAELERYPPWSIASGVRVDLDRRDLTGDREAVPGALHGHRVEARQPVLDPSGEHDVEISGRPVTGLHLRRENATGRRVGQPGWSRVLVPSRSLRVSDRRVPT